MVENILGFKKYLYQSFGVTLFWVRSYNLSYPYLSFWVIIWVPSLPCYETIWVLLYSWTLCWLDLLELCFGLGLCSKHLELYSSGLTTSILAVQLYLAYLILLGGGKSDFKENPQSNLGFVNEFKCWCTKHGNKTLRYPDMSTLISLPSETSLWMTKYINGPVST